MSFSSWSTGNAKNAQPFKATPNTSTEDIFNLTADLSDHRV